MGKFAFRGHEDAGEHRQFMARRFGPPTEKGATPTVHDKELMRAHVEGMAAVTGIHPKEIL